ncbi:hypothetical protein GQ43DRAFT_343943, partial [Delitschia confertaspora ATCC 74209]
VKLLIDKGADVNAQGGACGNAPQAASYVGEEKIMGLLMNNGAYVNVEEEGCDTVLQTASLSSHEQVVKLLV